jgi:nitroreductase
MDFLELSQKRYSVLHYLKEPVPEEWIQKILEAGMSAPTACNFQPQKIKFLHTDEDRRKLNRVVPSKFYVPAAFLVCYDKNACWTRKFDQKSSGEIDAAIVTTHMMLAASDLGLGSIWVMYWDPDTMKREFEIPEQYEPVALLIVGYPDREVAPHKEHFRRKKADEVLF